MSDFVHLQTITDFYNLFKPVEGLRHPLIAVVDFGKVKSHISDGTMLSADFYSIMYKTYQDTVRYGRKPFDFQNGALICMAPNQVIEMDNEVDTSVDMTGWGLFFHADLIRGTSLGDKMKNYSFLSYQVSEALHLSEKEQQTLHGCVQKIDAELQENIDVYSQEIIVSNIELLLNYCTRFYGRQFITRKTSNNSIIARIETILTDYFKHNQIQEQGLPTVKFLADQVNLSPGYLSDLLKKETGKNTQDHIHFYLIEEAKNILLSTNKSVGEIAYSLGFEYPQYFNKLFKQKTGKTPVEFRGMN